MTASTGVTQKTLFVGDAWICRQVAYVLDVQDYALADQLTAENYPQFRDHQIYVCAFKRQSRGLVARELKQTKPTIQYLDDICRMIDQEYAAARRRHRREKPTTRPQLGTRVQLGLRAQLRTVRNRLLRVRCWSIMRAAKHGQSLPVKKSRLSDLRFLKPSELFLYVLHAQPNPHIHCVLLETEMTVGQGGDIFGCCSVPVHFGNLLRDGELDEIYHSTYARIIKLSSLNRSYCLCDLNGWCLQYHKDESVLPTAQFTTPQYPQNLVMGYDQTCNLCCPSCRNQHYVMSEATRHCTNECVTKLLRSGYLEQTPTLVTAGMGEVFYSPSYRQLLDTDLPRKNISILSNGTLFNAANWRWLKGKAENIDVTISVDAATPETYQKLRGSNFDHLMQNLQMLADLRRQNQIRSFNLHFVVQRDNFREMPAFVELGRRLGVDSVQFLRMRNFGNLAPQIFAERCLIIDDTYLDRELWDILQDPIFRDPIVNLRGLQRYIDASESRYR